jgi:hypothetical protein
MTETPTTQIPLPIFDDWANFSVGQLEAMLIAWEWMRDQPEWAMWHEGAKLFVSQIEAELNQRSQERARLVLQHAIADWGMAHDRLWRTADANAATDAVEQLLATWGHSP